MVCLQAKTNFKKQLRLYDEAYGVREKLNLKMQAAWGGDDTSTFKDCLVELADAQVQACDLSCMP